MITPKTGDVVIKPKENFSSYFCSKSAGIMNPPMATTVATVEPEMAPNKPQAKTPAMPRPPGSQPTKTLAILISLSTIDPAVIMLPHRTKKRTTTRAKLSILRKRV